MQKKQEAKSSKVIMLKMLRWSAAAAILVLAGLGVYSLFNDRIIFYWMTYSLKSISLSAMLFVIT